MIQAEFDECIRKAKLYNWTLNQKKDFLQKDRAISTWIRKPNFGHGILKCYTGFGKTTIARQVCARFRKRYGNDEPIVIVVPSNPIAEQWESFKQEFPNTLLYIINTFTGKRTDIIRDCGLLIVDEVHHAAGENSQFFSTLFGIVKRRFTLGLTATLSKEQAEFLQRKYKLGVVWEITLEEGDALGLLPDYIVCNIGVELTKDEKIAYNKHDADYDFYLSKFSVINQSKAWGLAMQAMVYKNKEFRESLCDTYARMGLVRPEESDFQKWGARMNIAQKNRNLIIQRSYYKHNMVMNILKWKRKIVLFTTAISCLTWWKRPNAVAYHTKGITPKQRKDALKGFKEGVYNILLSCKALIEGWDDDTAEVALVHDYTSNDKDIEQIIGRVLRPRKDGKRKLAIIVFLYCKTYKTIRGEDEDATEIFVIPQDQKRLRNGQQGIKGIVEEVKYRDLLERI